MKKILCFALLFLSVNLFGQIKPDSLIGVQTLTKNRYAATDTIPKVILLNEIKKTKPVLWYLNGQIVEKELVSLINFNQIEDLKILKDSVELNGTQYVGKILVTTKDNYTLKLITLNKLKAKYLSLPDDLPTLFMIDDKVIDQDYDQFQVDENYILKIEVQIIDNQKEALRLALIKLIPRTAENLKEANTIRLKGNGISETIPSKQ